ncbi:MAG: DUF523 and DUF1722 domain-containing protein [Planctomycetes bacterium]|nr:DUF523 and DUF1722 domain-containing protein [Planctomycetota bacterium]
MNSSASSVVDPAAPPRSNPIRIGVSACLLGREVRWDGGHKRDRFVTDGLGRFVEFVPLCPEVESGLSIPRPTLRLAGEIDDPRLVFGDSGADYTEVMRSFARARLHTLADLDLCGFILKSDSPSCGLERVRVYGKGGMALRKGRGLFAAELAARFPLLPLEEEGRLNDAKLRETFVERVFAYRRWLDFVAAGVSLARMVDFHRIHKYLLLAHSPEHYAACGRLVARGKALSRAELREQYGELFMRGMARAATRGRHTNVLQHMAGYFKKQLDAASKDELHRTLDDYSDGLVPLIVPITLIRHHVRVFGLAYLEEQVYLAPHPKELMLRNQV